MCPLGQSGANGVPLSCCVSSDALHPRVQAISGQLRIPQRKPWQSMADDAAAAAVLASDAPRMLAGVLPGEGEQQGRELLVGIQDTLAR